MSPFVSGGWTCCVFSLFMTPAKFTIGAGISPFGALLTVGRR